MIDQICVCGVKSCSTLCNPMAVAHQAPLSMGFSRQEYWSGLPCPLAGDLPDTGVEPTSLTSPALAGGFFTTSDTWQALDQIYNSINQWWEYIITLGKGGNSKRETFLDHKRLVSLAVQRLWASINRAKCSDSPLIGLPTKSLSCLGVSIPSAVGQTSHKSFPNLDRN